METHRPCPVGAVSRVVSTTMVPSAAVVRGNVAVPATSCGASVGALAERMSLAVIAPVAPFDAAVVEGEGREVEPGHGQGDVIGRGGVEHRGCVPRGLTEAHQGVGGIRDRLGRRPGR